MSKLAPRVGLEPTIFKMIICKSLFSLIIIGSPLPHYAILAAIVSYRKND
ncbi:MAG: hypothetical protein ISS13_01260 [Actinobacteria bacterium]|nr:hypothetical protein [Actinomycetota bacterium]